MCNNINNIDDGVDKEDIDEMKEYMKRMINEDVERFVGHEYTISSDK